MTISRITPTTPVCMGVCCHQHASCNRYALVDGASDTTPRIATCQEDSEFPLFVQVRPAVVIHIDHGPAQLQLTGTEAVL